MIVNTPETNAAIRQQLEFFRKILKDDFDISDQEFSLHLLGNAAFDLGHAGYPRLECVNAFHACYRHGQESANQEKRSDP